MVAYIYTNNYADKKKTENMMKETGLVSVNFLLSKHIIKKGDSKILKKIAKRSSDLLAFAHILSHSGIHYWYKKDDIGKIQSILKTLKSSNKLFM